MNVEIKELTIDILEEMHKSFLETLSNLKLANNISLEESKKILKKINNQDSHIFVAISNNEIVGTLTVIIEFKFIHNGSIAGHIEDVAIRKAFEGKGIASELIKKAVDFSKDRNCYKLILDCENELIKFYEKFDFKHKGAFMILRFDSL